MQQIADENTGDIPVSAVLTSASIHDSQAAIPLMQLTAGRLTSLYTLMHLAALTVAKNEDRNPGARSSGVRSVEFHRIL